MTFKILLTFALCLILNIYANHSHANIYMYKWKNADGELHYTEYAPTKGIEYERIRVTQTRSAQSSGAKKIKPDNKNKETDLVKDDSYKSWQKENCTMAKQNLDILENATRIAQDDGEGGTRLMNDEEKQASIEKMKQQIDKYCKEQP